MSSKSKPPSPPVFFLDRSLGKKVIAGRLREAGAKVEIHDDHFPTDTKDEVWLAEVAKKNWIILTKDSGIRYRTSALLIIKKAGARLFVLKAGDLQGSEMAEVFVRGLPAIYRFAARKPPPFIAKVTRGGYVSIWVSGLDFP